MKAAYYDATGGPEVIQFGELARPVPKEGEVLVRVAAAALNPIDTYIRAGMVNMPLPKPFVPGCDFAGTVEAVRPGVNCLKAGDRVWGSNQGLLGRQGTFAEYACVNQDWCYKTPPEVADIEAAAAALVGITAHLGLFRCANLQPGEIVFVNGGAGGVGSAVVQMAKAVGASVITTAGSATKMSTCKSMGADLVLDYKSDGIPAGVRSFTRDKGVNVWYETQPPTDMVRIVDLVARRGRIVLMAGRQAQPIFPVGAFYTRDQSMFGFAMFNSTPDEQRRCATDMNRWMSEKKLRVPIGRTFRFSEAAAAHKLQEENTLRKAGTLSGKILLTP